MSARLSVCPSVWLAARTAHALTTAFSLQARNKDQEKEILDWIETVTGEKLPSAPYEDVLKDGVVLCNLINKIAPGSVNKIQTKGTNFQLMENVQRYGWFLFLHRYHVALVLTQPRAASVRRPPLVTASIVPGSRLRSASTASLTRRSSRRRTCSRGGTSLRSHYACTPSAES